MYESPEAQKAREGAAARERGYWPRLARTASKAVVLRPLCGGRQYQRQFAGQMAHLLPDFRFNGKADRWEGDLGRLEAAYNALGPRVHLSDGASEYLT